MQLEYCTCTVCLLCAMSSDILMTGFAFTDTNCHFRHSCRDVATGICLTVAFYADLHCNNITAHLPFDLIEHIYWTFESIHFH